MDQTVEFPSNGHKASGYLVTPPGGRGPGVLVIQEWWGLDSGIKTWTDRLGAAGFVALAPDLYHGQLAAHDEMDKAAHLMQTLPPARAARDMSVAVDYLAGHAAVTSPGIGVVGFCMGGMLSFIIAANRPDKVKALVPFYGFPQGDMEPDWAPLAAAVCGHMAEHDSFFGPDAARALEARLRKMGKRCVAHGARRHRPCLHGTPQRARNPGPSAVRPDLARRRLVPARDARVAPVPGDRHPSGAAGACSR